METELKLTASAAHLHKISSQRLLQDFATAEPTTRQLTSHYFDTPDATLHKLGFALRVRDDASMHTQTLKATDAAAAQSGPLQRGEWEAPARAKTPDLRRLRKDAHLPRKVARTLRRVSRTGKLAEQFTVRARRTTWTLDVDGASIAMALDEGTTRANGSTSPFSEIELELLSGKPAALYTAAHALARHIPVQLSFVSKAERGFALLEGGLQPRKAGKIALPANATVEQGVQRILAACLAHAQSNVQGFLDSDDPEYLHQLRVGMRRFKSALKLFRGVVALPAELQRQVDELSTLLGAARDADVLLLTTLPRIRDAGKHGAFLQPLFQHAQAHAQEQRTAARHAIHSTHHAQMMLDLFAWVDGRRWRKAMSRAGRARLRRRLTGYARRAVADAHATVAKRARKVQQLGGRDSAAVHRLRIGCKQARYAVEFFTAIERPKQAARYIKRLSRAQDALGMFNDGHVAQTLLATFTQAQPALTPAVSVVKAYLNGIASVQLAGAPWRKLGRQKAARAAHHLVQTGGR